VFFQDGHNLFFAEESFCGETWQLSEAMDNVCCSGGIIEQIIVGVYPVSRQWEYLPTYSSNLGYGGGADRYLDFLTHELRPEIDRHLRTVRDSYSIAGSSYGGCISLYAWVTRPKEFKVCGAFSPSVGWDNNVLFGIVEKQLTERPPGHKLYIDCGSRDQKAIVTKMVEHVRRLNVLKKDQIFFVVGEDHRHTERDWALRTPLALAYMFADPLRSKGDFFQQITN